MNEITEEKAKYINSIFVPAGFVLLLWLIKLAEIIFSYKLVFLGVYPGKISGLIGIITAPLVHGNFEHLIANSLPLIILGAGIIYSYKDSAVKVLAIVYFVPSIFVWLFAREAYHIGASGVIYGMVTFLFFSGIIRRDPRAIALSLIVTFLYGSLIWGVLPLDNQVSWESHLSGAITGFACAIIFRKKDPYKKYDWEDEEIDENEKPEISYDKENPFI